jgi:hypothetical protein
MLLLGYVFILFVHREHFDSSKAPLFHCPRALLQIGVLPSSQFIALGEGKYMFDRFVVEKAEIGLAYMLCCGLMFFRRCQFSFSFGFHFSVSAHYIALLLPHQYYM